MPTPSAPATGVGFHTRFHPVVLSGAVSFAATVVAIVILIIERNDLAAGPARQLALAGAAVALGGFVPPVVRWRRSNFAVHADGLHLLTGFLRVHRALFPHDTVQTVEVHSTMVGRALDYGTVRIIGTDGAYEELPRVARAEAFRDAALAAGSSSRRRRTTR